MAQFITIDEAAERLGISKDELNQRREAGDIRAFRDGGSWKFKEEDVDKFAATLAAGDADDILDLAGGELDLGTDSILLSEHELGESGKGPSSTVIGKSGDAGGADSDVRIADEAPAADSAINLGGASDVQLAGGTSDVLGGVSGLGSQFENLEELGLDLDAESGKVIDDSNADSLKLGADDLALGSGTGSALSLTGEDLTGSGSGSASGGSALELAADDEDELVLGEGSGSDITISSEDSGIGLAKPSDSGLSLDEEPLELGGSQVESLELGEDDEVSLDLASMDSEAATQLKADDDFMLTPLDDAGGEETEDSGSQVIALDSESFDESADTMLGGSAVGAAVLADQLGDMSTVAVAGTAASPLMPAPVTVPEAPYSVWNVLSLMLCFVLLALTGMMMYDLLRNIWSWNEPYAANSAVMDGLIGLVGWPK